MPQRIPRLADGRLDTEKVTQAYVLMDENGRPFRICLCIDGTWISVPYTPELNNELAGIFGDQYIERDIHGMLALIVKYEHFAAILNNDLNSAKRKVRPN